MFLRVNISLMAMFHLCILLLFSYPSTRNQSQKQKRQFKLKNLCRSRACFADYQPVKTELRCVWQYNGAPFGQNHLVQLLPVSMCHASRSSYVIFFIFIFFAGFGSHEQKVSRQGMFWQLSFPRPSKVAMMCCWCFIPKCPKIQTMHKCWH